MRPQRIDFHNELLFGRSVKGLIFRSVKCFSKANVDASQEEGQQARGNRLSGTSTWAVTKESLQMPLLGVATFGEPRLCGHWVSLHSFA